MEIAQNVKNNILYKIESVIIRLIIVRNKKMYTIINLVQVFINRTKIQKTVFKLYIMELTLKRYTVI